ncbi:MAG TPA: DUF1203 domain-containing protein [Acetobacteraceae bacterium]|nr:DUF1203 domain-containing protein [Acetobacteraceae bacterium]
MPEFRCLPIPPDVAARFRHGLRDDRGSPFLRRGPGPDSRCPCRVCLRYAAPNETVLLGSYDLPRPRGVYWTPSPIFLHETECAPFAAANTIPEIVRGSLISVRAYDADDLCLYDLGHVGEGAEAEGPLLRALFDPRTAFVNIHTAKPGCLLCRVERA